jgi:hypothetical protein
MSIKLILLQSGEQVITDAREVISDEKTVAYLFKNPHRVTVTKPFLVAEDSESEDLEDKLQVTLGPWILLTSNDEIAVPSSYVITIVDPIESLEKMYLEKTNPPTQKSIPNLSNEALSKLREQMDMGSLDLQKLSEIYTPEELESLKELYLGSLNGTNDQVSSSEE